MDEKRRSTARQRDELADLGQRLSALVLECTATGEVPSERIRREIGVERLQAAAAPAPGELPPLEMQELEQLAGSYTHLLA